MRENGDACRAPECIERVARERSACPEPLDAVSHLAVVERQRLRAIGDVVGERAEPGCGVSACVVRVERGSRERPTAVRHPRTGREVDVVQGYVAHQASHGSSPDAPQMCVACELTPPFPRVGPELAVVEDESGECLRARLGSRAARLDDADTERVVVQLAGNRDPCRPRTHDAYVGVDLRSVRERTGVCQHRSTGMVVVFGTPIMTQRALSTGCLP